MTVYDLKQNRNGKKRGDRCPCHGKPMEFEPGSIAGLCLSCGHPLVYTSGGHGGVTHAFEGREMWWPRKGATGKWPDHPPQLKER